MPLIAWQPGKVKAGHVDETTVISGLDFFPTFSALAGATAVPKGDGENMAAALTGDKVERETALFWEYGRNSNSFAYPRDVENRSPTLAIREGKWKLLCNPDGSDVELYDLQADAKEKTNLAGGEKERVKKMKTALLAWRKAMP